MENTLQLSGLKANLVLVESPVFGTLKELEIFCTKEQADEILKVTVKRHIPWERTATGIKLYQ